MGSTMTQVIVALISGGVGGNIAGAVMKNLSLGAVGNTIVGLIGGGLGGQLLLMAGVLQKGGTVAMWATPKRSTIALLRPPT